MLAGRKRQQLEAEAALKVGVKKLTQAQFFKTNVVN